VGGCRSLSTNSHCEIVLRHFKLRNCGRADGQHEEMHCDVIGGFIAVSLSSRRGHRQIDGRAQRVFALCPSGCLGPLRVPFLDSMRGNKGRVKWFFCSVAALPAVSFVLVVYLYAHL